MSAWRSRVVAAVELARVSNAPTCVSNVLVGVAIGIASGGARPDVPTITLLVVAVLLLYFGGMVLNDAMDAPRDAIERPERAVPSGRVSRRGAFVFAGVLLLAGLVLLAMSGAMAGRLGVVLLACIIAYDVMHGRVPASVVLMGCCRGLVYLATAAAIAWPPDWSIALPLTAGMTMYIVLLTIVARVEARRDPGRRGGLGFLLPLVALAPLAFLSPVDRTWTAIAAALAAASILLASRHAAARPARIGIAVQGWLAAICVVDAMYLVALDEVAFAAVAAGCFVLTRLGHRVIVGT